MKELYIKHIASLMGLHAWQVENCVEMFADGDTIPFISRYRKEKTGGLDDASVAELKHYCELYDEMEKRKQTILKTISEAGALTDTLKEAIENCLESSTLEDMYLPYRPKRRTRATVAKELGLEPLALGMWELREQNPRKAAAKFVTDKVEDEERALSLARDIVAEKLSESAAIRESLRTSMRTRRIVSRTARGAKDSAESSKYRNYLDYSFPLDKIPSHNLLAVLRGESEGILSISLDCDSDKYADKIYRQFLGRRPRPSRELEEQLRLSCLDSFDRLLESSIGSEVIAEAKRKADIESIKVFGDNLRQLLLSPPVGQKRTMAIDPGFRNGCKIVCLGSQGELLDHTVVFPHPPQNEKVKAITTLQALLDKYKIEAIALGNGTASRETSEFIKRLRLPQGCKIWTVSEDGASIYSASEAAREEFPDEDVTVRGAVSIGRRLMDPLSELVKIDPKNLGVGQYQHDVDQKLLRDKLNDTVESCVNSVGVNLNTASQYLLSYVAGIGPSLAAKIVSYRNSQGAFGDRRELLKVPRLGAKAYEQCAGFLRIRGGENPLDCSAVHPESYPIVEKMASDLGVNCSQLIGNKELIDKLSAEDYVTESKGLPTINDILRELRKPGLDPREEASEFAFDENVHSIEDLHEGMILPGIVTNITAFGAFVDIGLHENGLLHVSTLGRRGTEVSKVLRLHQNIMVKVLGVDLERGRISLAPAQELKHAS